MTRSPKWIFVTVQGAPLSLPGVYKVTFFPPWGGNRIHGEGIESSWGRKLSREERKGRMKSE